MSCCLIPTVCVTVKSCCSLNSPWWFISRPQSALYRAVASDDTCSRHWLTFQLLVSSDFGSASQVLPLREALRSHWQQFAVYISGDLNSEGVFHILCSLKGLYNCGDLEQKVNQRDYHSSHAVGLVVITAWPNFLHCQQLYLRRTNLSILAPAWFNYPHATRLTAGSTLLAQA